MNTTTVPETAVNLIGRLANLNLQRKKLQERIDHYEKKLTMIRKVNLSLTTEEQDLTNQLRSQGFLCGNLPQTPSAAQPSTQLSTQESGLAGDAQQQLNALLGFLQQHPNKSYNFPQPSNQQLTTPIVASPKENTSSTLTS